MRRLHVRDWHGKCRAKHRVGFRADGGRPDQLTMSPGSGTPWLSDRRSSLFERSAMASNTGCRFDGDDAITLSMSAVAVCRASASPPSR